MLSPRRLRLLAIAFVGVLATYSGVWMYYIRCRNAANARGFDYAYSPSARAVEVRSVRADGAAAKAGLHPGDRIVAIDGVPLDRVPRVSGRVRSPARRAQCCRWR